MFNISKRLIAAFFRYAIAGGIGFVLDYGVLTICYEVLGLHYLVASVTGFVAGMVFVYLCSNKWVFATRSMADKAWLEFAIFAIIGVVGLGLTVLMMWIFVEVFKIYPLISKLFTTALVLLWNFFARKIILYT